MAIPSPFRGNLFTDSPDIADSHGEASLQLLIRAAPAVRDLSVYVCVFYLQCRDRIAMLCNGKFGFFSSNRFRTMPLSIVSTRNFFCPASSNHGTALMTVTVHGNTQEKLNKDIRITG